MTAKSLLRALLRGALLRARQMWRAASLALSEVREIAGFRVAVLVVDADHDRIEKYFSKIETALRLIERTTPRRFAHLRRDVRCIWVTPLASNVRGEWHAIDASCILSERSLGDDGVSPTLLASTIVHEGMHARLHRAGHTPTDATRERHEKICWRASRAFLRRAPDTEEHVERVNSVLKQPRFTLTENEIRDGNLLGVQDLLREGRGPLWMRRLIRRLAAAQKGPRR